MSLLSNGVLLLGKEGRYLIKNSLRFCASSITPLLSRTMSTPTSQSVWTFSAWVKRGDLFRTQYLISVVAGAGIQGIGFSSDASLTLFNTSGTGAPSASSTNKLRDSAGWYHIVVKSTGSQIIGYVNGEQVVTTTGTWNVFNTAVVTRIGLNTADSFDGVLAEVIFVDGIALNPTSFGKTLTQPTRWIPIAYTGAYNANGYRLDFSDATSLSTIGYDRSGNNNNFTATGFRVGVTSPSDSLVDSPTMYSALEDLSNQKSNGNYCTLNPSIVGTGTSIKDGGLVATLNLASVANALGTFSVNSGKWYWEVETSHSNSQSYVGITSSNSLVANSTAWSSQPDPKIRAYRSDGLKYNGSGTSYGANWNKFDTIGVALDCISGTLTFYKNGVSQGVAYSEATFGEQEWRPFISDLSGFIVNYFVNFGQYKFKYSIPNGYRPLCSTFLNSEKRTLTGTYTGNGLVDGPFIQVNGVPENVAVYAGLGWVLVTFPTYGDRLCNGFKIRSTLASFNQSGTVYTYTLDSLIPFRYANAQIS